MSGTTIRLGITVMPEYVQCEGLEIVLHNICDVAGACDLTTVPSVMEPADGEDAEREPPIDGGAGKVRLLDRPLWGKRALAVRTAPSFEPDPRFYTETPYPPPQVNALTRREGDAVASLLAGCRARQVRTWLQVLALIPPGIRVQFGGPRDADRALPAGGDADPLGDRVARSGSPASPALRSYLEALLCDLARAYPDAEGFRIDWPEYAPYSFDTLFFDYSEAAVALGQRLGFDVAAIRAGMVRLASAIPALARPGALAALARSLDREGIDALLRHHPAIGPHLALRAAIVADFSAFVAGVTHRLGKRLFLQGFPWPWNRLTGFDPRANAAIADVVGVKLYTMHWPMIARNYYDRLVSRGAPAGPTLAALLVRALDIGPTPAAAEALRYPEPDEPHPADDRAIAAKIAEARADVEGAELWAISHGYGPLDDVLRRLRVAASATGGRVSLNRYGYLNDAKLQAVGQLVRGA